MRIRPNWFDSGNRKVASKIYFDAELSYDRLEVADRELERKASVRQVTFNIGGNDIVDVSKEPSAPQHFEVSISKIATEVKPRLFGQKGDVAIDESIVTECIRRPELDPRAVAANASDLLENVVGGSDVFKKVCRENVIDGIVVKGKPVMGEIEYVVHARRRHAIQSDKTLSLGAAATEVDL